MKTKLISLILLSTLFSHTSYSQQLKITVNQLEMGQQYTSNQIINNMGTPNEIINEPDDVFSNAVTYKYGNNSLTFIEDRLCFFTINDTTLYVNGILKVGQNKSMISQLGGVVMKTSVNFQKNYGTIIWKPYENYLNGLCSMTIYYDLQTNLIDGIIIEILVL